MDEPRRFRYLWVLLVLLPLPFLFTRCGKIAGPPPGTFGAVYTNTLSKACIECHVPTGAATVDNGCEIDFSTQAKAYSTLLAGTVKGLTSTGICGGVNLVKAGDPDNSYLAAVLFAELNVDDFGGQAGCSPYNMHLQDQSLSAAEKESLLDWIRNGAKND